MKSKGEAHQALSTLFHSEGVPSTMIMDNAPEQIQGEFRKKLNQVDCRVHRIEPFTPQSNAAERTIKELKRGTGRKMTKSKSPKVLWDYCLELEAFICSNTAINTFRNQGEVPETLISGKTANISPFAEFAWYDSVVFRDSGVSYLDDKLALGRYLGPASYVGPAMTARILTKTGKVCLLYTSPSPRDGATSRMPSSA